MGWLSRTVCTCSYIVLVHYLYVLVRFSITRTDKYCMSAVRPLIRCVLTHHHFPTTLEIDEVSSRDLNQSSLCNTILCCKHTGSVRGHLSPETPLPPISLLYPSTFILCKASSYISISQVVKVMSSTNNVIDFFFIFEG